MEILKLNLFTSIHRINTAKTFSMLLFERFAQKVIVRIFQGFSVKLKKSKRIERKTKITRIFSRNKERF